MNIKKKNSSYFKNYAFKKYRPKKLKIDRATKVNSKFIVNKFLKLNINLHSYLNCKFNIKFYNLICNCLYYINYINFIYIFIFKNIKTASKIIINILEADLIFIKFIFIIFFNKLKKKSFINKKKKLKNKKWFFLKKKLRYKITNIKIERLLYKCLKFKSKVVIQNILNIINPENILRIPHKALIWNWFTLFYFVDFLYIFFFSIYLKNSNLLSWFIAKYITSKKSHFFFLKKIKRLLFLYFHHGTKFDIKGVFFKVCGKFQGKLRKRKFIASYKKKSLTTFTDLVSFSISQSYTKFGVFSIKVWLIYKYKSETF